MAQQRVHKWAKLFFPSSAMNIEVSKETLELASHRTLLIGSRDYLQHQHIDMQTPGATVECFISSHFSVVSLFAVLCYYQYHFSPFENVNESDDVICFYFINWTRAVKISSVGYMTVMIQDDEKRKVIEWISVFSIIPESFLLLHIRQWASKQKRQQKKGKLVAMTMEQVKPVLLT